MEVRNSCRLHLPGARIPGRSALVILFWSTSEADLLSTSESPDVTPSQDAKPVGVA